MPPGGIRSCGCVKRQKALAARVSTEPPAVPGAKWIPLTRGKFALVDDLDFGQLGHLIWTYDTAGYAFYNSGSRPVRLHNLLMPARPAMRVDHINRDRLDNRRCNLRYATFGQSNFNRGIERGNKAGYKGVTKQSTGAMWRAVIRRDNKQHEIGRARDAWTASCLYDAEAIRLFGEFAAPNNAPMPSVPEHLRSRNARSAPK